MSAPKPMLLLPQVYPGYRHGNPIPKVCYDFSFHVTTQQATFSEFIITYLHILVTETSTHADSGLPSGDAAKRC